MKRIVVFGAAGQAKVAIEAIEQIGTHRVAGVIADSPMAFASPYPFLGGDGHVKRLWQEMGGFDGHIAVGDVAARRRIAERLRRELPELMFPPIVHPLARLAKNATIAPGAFVAIGAAVCADARVGAHAIVNTNASVDHDCALGDYSFVGPNAALGGTVVVGDGAFIGIGASVLPNLRIGANAIVGAGAVVLRDVADGAWVVGVPARARE